MVGTFSLISVMLGSAIAAMAERFPARVETLETCAGALLIGGLALLGTALPAIL